MQFKYLIYLGHLFQNIIKKQSSLLHNIQYQNVELDLNFEPIFYVTSVAVLEKPKKEKFCFQRETTIFTRFSEKDPPTTASP